MDGELGAAFSDLIQGFSELFPLLLDVFPIQSRGKAKLENDKAQSAS
jgi:hypothetical protein